MNGEKLDEMAARYACDSGLASDAEVIGEAKKVLEWCLENGYFSTELTSALI